MGITLTPAPSAARDQLLARLAEDKTVDAINRLLDRLETITFVVDALEGFLARADTVAESVADSVADLKTMAGEGTPTADVVGKLPELAKVGVQMAGIASTPSFQRILNSDLIDRLGNPDTIEAVKGVLERLELASFSLESIDGFLRRSDQISHALSDDVEDLKRASSSDIGTLKEMLDALPVLLTAGQTLLKSGMLEPGTVTVLGNIGHTAAQSFNEAKTAQKEPRTLGLMGLLKALRDPDVNRALDFGLHFAKAYGQSLRNGKQEGA